MTSSPSPLTALFQVRASSAVLQQPQSKFPAFSLQLDVVPLVNFAFGIESERRRQRCCQRAPCLVFFQEVRGFGPHAQAPNPVCVAFRTG